MLCKNLLGCGPHPEEVKERGREDSPQFLTCRSEDNPELFIPYEIKS